MTTNGWTLLDPGDTVTIWPMIDRAAGMSYDTEGGAQPWKAIYLGTLPDGRLLVRHPSGKYPSRPVVSTALSPS